MKAISIEQYGSIDQFHTRDVPEPELGPRDLLVRVMGVSVNPVDTKNHDRPYDDYPDYYDHVPRPFHICGFDASGTVTKTGPQCRFFEPGDQVFYSCSPERQGSNAELQAVNERSVGHKPRNLDFVEAAVMPLTCLTAYEALEKAGLLVINGPGGVGAMASQIARFVLGLECVVTTASRGESVAFTKEMGATHVVNHREDLVAQIEGLELDVPLKYIFKTHSTDQYMPVVARLCAPFGKVCSIVQGQPRMYDSEFMAKSLSFVWCLLGTKPYYRVDLDSHHEILEELARLVDEGFVKCHLTTRLRLTLDGLKEGHAIVESGRSMRKVGLGVGEEGSQAPFT